MNLASIFSTLLGVVLLSPTLLAAGLKPIAVECDDRRLKKAAIIYFKPFQSTPQSLESMQRLIEVFTKKGGMMSYEIIAEPPRGFTVKLHTKKRLHDVRFLNNHYFSRGELLGTLQYTAETLVYLEDLTSYENAIRKLYLDAAFPKVVVKAAVAPTVDDPGAVDLTIDIQEGAPVILDSFVVRGDANPLDSKEIQNFLEISPGKHVDPTKLRKRLEELRLRYVALDYLGARVSIESATESEDASELSLTVVVEKGAKILVQFRTAKYFLLDRDRILKEQIGLGSETRFSRGYLDEAVDRLKTFYQSQGYPNSQVEVQELTDTTTDVRHINFLIAKGPRVKIRSIAFDKDDSITLKTLNSLVSDLAIGDLYDASKARLNVKELQRKLQEIGYHDAEEATLEERHSGNLMDLLIWVRADRRYHFGSTHIQVEGALSEKRLRSLLTYKTKQPFLLLQLENSLNRIRNTCQEEGYKNCAITQQLTPTSKSNVKDIQIQIKTGEKMRVGSILINGNRLTQDRVIARELAIATGDVMAPSKIEKSQRQIQRLGFFSSVQIEELPAVANQIDLLIRVREKKPRNIRFRVGFGSDEGARAASDFSYLNLAGTGRNLYLSSGLSRKFRDDVDDILEWRLVSNYIEPRLFNSPLNGRLQFGFARDEEEFGNIERLGFFAGLEYNQLTWVQNLLKWEIESRTPFDLLVDPADLSAFDQAERLFGSLGNQLTLDFRDNPFNPTFGYFGQISTNLYSESFLSEEEFYQVFSRNTFFLPLYKSVSLVASVRLGFAATYGTTASAGNDQIPVEKRFRLGGSQSLRGFSLDTVGGQSDTEPALGGGDPAPGGNSVFNYMAEIGFPLPWGFRLVGFTDGGNAYLTNSDFDLLNVRKSAGFGLRYVTPIGPVRLDFGFKLDRRPAESVGELHFAVGLF